VWAFLILWRLGDFLMTEKPTYEELEQRVKELAQEVINHKHADEGLLDFQAIFKNIESGLYIYHLEDINDDKTLKMVSANQAAADFTGVSINDVVGKTLDENFPGLRKKGIPQIYAEVVRSGKSKILEDVYYADDHVIQGAFSVKAFPLPNNCVGVSFENITERKQADEALRESEKNYKTLFADAGDALFIMEVDAERKPWFIECNQRTLNLFGCKSNEIIGKSPELFSPETQPDGTSSMEKAIELARLAMEGQPQDFQWLHHRYDNKKPFWVEVKLTRLTLGGKANYMQAVLRNITERKQAEERVRNLSRQLITSQENERQMISYELHDSVAQDLSSSRIICEILLEDSSLKPAARKQISEISENLHTTLKSVRDLSYELRPPGLEDLGLVQTLYQFCEDFSEQTGISVDFQSAGMGNLNLDYNTKINLYRLLQEGLNNIKKHADASNVKIRLISSFPNVILRIYDDGRGFDLKERVAKTSSEKRMGLSSMEQRVDLLLGRINIESSPGKGTKVVIKIPYKDVIEIKSEI
jgi:PAS domain S-box-containing protein